MRLLPFIASAIVTISLVTVLNTQLSIGTTKSPKLGYFLSPQHGFWKNAEKITLLKIVFILLIFKVNWLN